MFKHSLNYDLLQTPRAPFNPQNTIFAKYCHIVLRQSKQSLTNYQSHVSGVLLMSKAFSPSWSYSNILIFIFCVEYTRGLRDTKAGGEVCISLQFLFKVHFLMKGQVAHLLTLALFTPSPIDMTYHISSYNILTVVFLHVFYLL